MSCADSNSAAIPTPCVDTQGDGRWMSLHNRFVSDSKDKEPDVLFVGDSLVQLLQQFEPKMVRMMGPGKGAGQGTPRMGCQIITRRTGLCTETLKVWRDLFSPLHALNFGVGGDATQNVLWRLSNGELDHISPKVVVLWVGTNNHGHTPEQICEGIIAIARLISNKLLHAHTLILGLLPRGENPNTLRDRNAKVNELLQQAVPSLPRASYLSVDRGFVQPNGKISHQDMYDYLHLTPQGYHNVCKPVHDAITHLLEKRGEN